MTISNGRWRYDEDISSRFRACDTELHRLTEIQTSLICGERAEHLTSAPLTRYRPESTLLCSKAFQGGHSRPLPDDHPIGGNLMALEAMGGQTLSPAGSSPADGYHLHAEVAV